MWKSVVGYEGLYEVNELGQVRSIGRLNTKGIVLRQYSNNGYMYVALSKIGKVKRKRVHRVVLEAFVGRDDEKQVNHINGDKSDNRLENLEYCTASENQKHSYANGFHKKYGKRCMCVDDGNVFETLKDCSKFYGGDRSNQVRRVCDGSRKTFRGRRFVYV